MEVEEVIKKVEECNNSLVLITGGEPLLQNSTFPLMEQLCDKGFDVLLETSGDRDISKCDSRIVRIIDIKTPGSGAFGSFLDSNFDYLSSKDEIKFVITNKEDFDWAIQVVKEKKLCSLSGFVHFSPVMEQEPNSEITGSKQLSAKQLASWIIDSGENVRLHLQMHKYIWDPITRGV
jgi:7-carboxy-7-deazaguanine synthase